jgi:hypothetical protein
VSFAITESQAPYSNQVKVIGTFDAATGRVAVDTALVGKPSIRAARAVAPPMQQVG